tara:strand:+ start:3558 stop:4688 length:1131 start_codon:yes stop_codon:yes gene_type:complete
MSKSYSPSDYITYNQSYDNARGFYCSGADVVALLQIPGITENGELTFTNNTQPKAKEVGKIMKRVEDYIDERIGHSFRKTIYTDEYHNFELKMNPGSYRAYIDYVGFIQLNHSKIRKVLALDVWQGSQYKNLAGQFATIAIDPTTFNSVNWIKLTLPDNDYFQLDGSNLFGTNLPIGDFNKKLGANTTAKEIVALINERFPTETCDFTGAIEAKALVSSNGKSISNYFYARLDSEDATKVEVISLLPGNDGSLCSITKDGNGVSLGNFSTHEENKRTDDWWTIAEEGKLFFREDFPYTLNNSVRITYLAGDTRVPAVINEVATKLVCAELVRHDDSTIMIGESGAQIDIKAKYDELKKDAESLLDRKRSIISLISD